MLSSLFGSKPEFCVAPRGRATIHRLEWVDRIDSPSGRSKGPPGRPAAHYLSPSPPISEVAFEELFAPGSSFVLYSIENIDTDAPFLVFLSLTPESRKAMWLEEAFIDRGIRKLVETGSKVAVASLESASDATCTKEALESFGAGSWQLSFVWNTGRCGSTLLHKAVSAMGTASFSEPHWLDQLHFGRFTEEQLMRALSTCIAIEALTARLQTAVPGWRQPTNFVFNPKAGGMPVAEAAVAAFPNARHAFMYRACHKVVESFGGLMFSDGVPTSLALLWRFLGLSTFRVLPAPPPRAGLPLAELSSFPVAMLTSRWIDTISAWIGTRSRRAESCGPDDPLASAVVLRMDEFTSKDLVLRATVVRTVLAHFGVTTADASDASLEKALAVFSVHSQAGSKMSGPKAPIVQAADVPIIKSCVALTFDGAAGVTVQQDGANLALADSLGVAE